MEKIMKYKKYIIFGAAIIFMLIVSILIYNGVNTDKMVNKGIYKVKYKVSQNDKWSKYSRNGITSGNMKDAIKNIDIKIKNSKKGSIYYSVYTGSWSDQIFQSTDLKKEITGIKIGITGSLYKKYSVCYRTYNKKDKWLNWTCDSNTSGNKEEPVTAIEIKIIPKKAVKFDYLKDYNKVKDSNKNF